MIRYAWQTPLSVITSHSARRLKLKQGTAAQALIKADSVILAVD